LCSSITAKIGSLVSDATATAVPAMAALTSMSMTLLLDTQQMRAEAAAVIDS
jgi:hypothetical protein